MGRVPLVHWVPQEPGKELCWGAWGALGAPPGCPGCMATISGCPGCPGHLPGVSRVRGRGRYLEAELLPHDAAVHGPDDDVVPGEVQLGGARWGQQGLARTALARGPEGDTAATRGPPRCPHHRPRRLPRGRTSRHQPPPSSRFWALRALSDPGAASTAGPGLGTRGWVPRMPHDFLGVAWHPRVAPGPGCPP